MGQDHPDTMLFDMLRSGDAEFSFEKFLRMCDTDITISFEKFLQMCDTDITSERARTHTHTQQSAGGTTNKFNNFLNFGAH